MRISPKSLFPAEAKANAQAQDEELPSVSQSDGAEAAPGVSSPAAIDAGRAQRLIERAAALAGRGDMGAAILAARQSLALAPDNVEAHLLHARLLERNRDFSGARAAYEKSVQLAPDRADASANLARLTAFLENSQGAARQFHFDDDELFAPDGNENAPGADAPGESDFATPTATAPTAATPAAPPIAAQSLEVGSMAMFDESMLPGVEARLPPTRVELAAQTPQTNANSSAPAPSAFMAQGDEQNAANRERTAQVAAPSGDRRKHNMPVATERRRRPVAGAAVPLAVPLAAPLVAPPIQAAAPTVAVPLRPASPNAAPAFDLGAGANRPLTRAPLTLDVPAAPAAPLWQQVMARPSFYARTLPLVGVALLSLGFLSWARGRAVSQVVAPAPTELASASGATGAPATVPGTMPLPNNAAQPGAPSGTDAAGFPISNAPAVFQAPGATTTGAATGGASGNGAEDNGARANNSAPGTTARANNRNNGGGRANRVLPPARPVPNFPGVSLAPAPIPANRVRNATSGGGASTGGNTVVLPRPSLDLPTAAEPRQRVLPPNDNGLNPAGSPNRGYVRVTEGRVGNGVIPAQPSAAARENERAANQAARNGQNDQAISQLSQAIRADSDNAGFRYQQRATLFLQRGDYNRASDDFQSAISAYQTQIANGTDVAGARRGLSSARSGLSLALAGKRG